MWYGLRSYSIKKKSFIEMLLSFMRKSSSVSPQPSRRNSANLSSPEFQQGPSKSIGQCWLPAKCGNVPLGAFVGGEDNGEPMYVIRSWYNGDLIPGKLLPSLEQGCLPWAGSEMAVYEYEVLCDFHGKWLPSYGSHIQVNAVVGGHTADGRPLYIGRVVHDGALTLGKVQPDGVLYVPYHEEEFKFTVYEILCSS